jgi:hypothetical protein
MVATSTASGRVTVARSLCSFLILLRPFFFSRGGSSDARVYIAIKFLLSLRDSFGRLFLPIFIVGIKTVFAFGVSNGNDLQIPTVLGGWYLYVVPKGHLCV